MVIRVNGIRVSAVPGMKVRHALIAAGLLDEVEAGKKVYDESGNEVGLDGALQNGLRLVVEREGQRR